MFTQNFKENFPIFKNYPKIVYLDNSATSQKPQIVIDSIKDYYEKYNFPIFKGYTNFSQKSQDLFTKNKQTIANFFQVSLEQLVLVNGGATQAINLLANQLKDKLPKNSTIVLSVAEHHANLMIWQKIAKEKKLKIEYLPIDEKGILDLNYFSNLLKVNPNISLIGLTFVSNVLGLINPLKKFGKLIEEYQKINQKRTFFLVDGAQAVSHLNFNFNHLKADCLFFSSHKMLGPLGIGGILTKKEFLSEIDPLILGGGIIQNVTLDDYQITSDQNQKFLAGTINGADVSGLAQACLYLKKIGLKNIQTETQDLVNYAFQKLSEISGLEIVGGQKKRLNLISFYFKNFDSFEISTFLASQNIIVRSGYHCAQPIHDYLKIPKTVRLSLQVYNTKEDIDKLVGCLKEIIK
jgi:cysteine desulfurase/selenocysteine lyase